MRIFEKIYVMVQKIPKGKVATYGQVARLVNGKWCMVNGRMVDSRVVGWALHANRSPNVPCHRVVSKEGKLAKSFAFGGEIEQRKRLLREEVVFKNKNQVDLLKFRWDWS